MSYGSNLGITLPTVSVTAGPAYATQINSALQTIINTLESKVTPSGMDISEDLTFKSGVNYAAALNLERATFENKSSAISASTYPVGLYVVGGELYYNDNSGNQVQVTSGGEVNVSATGGITGSGYGTGDVEVNWDSANENYRFRTGADADDFAGLACDRVELNDDSGHFMTVKTPSLSADKTVVLPDHPASDAFLQMDSSGTITASNAMTGDASINGNLSLTGTLTVDGEVFHGSKSVYIPAYAGMSLSAGSFSLAAGGWTSSSAAGEVVIPLSLHEGDQIGVVRAYVDPAGSGTKQILLYKVPYTTGVVTEVESATSTASVATTFSTADAAETVTGNAHYFAVFEAGDTGDVLFGIDVSYTHPE